jgi:hypothetical protein
MIIPAADARASVGRGERRHHRIECIKTQTKGNEGRGSPHEFRGAPCSHGHGQNYDQDQPIYVMCLTSESSREDVIVNVVSLQIMAP